MVVSPGGAVTVTGMWMELLFRPAWLALVEFFWLSASSCFSPRLRPLRIGCKGLEARPSSAASACLSLGGKKCRSYHRHHYTPLSGCCKFFLPNEEAHARKTGCPPGGKTTTYVAKNCTQTFTAMVSKHTVRWCFCTNLVQCLRIWYGNLENSEKA